MEVKKEVKEGVKHFVLDNTTLAFGYWPLAANRQHVLSFLTPMSQAN